MKKLWPFIALIVGIPLAWAALEYDIPNNVFKMGDGGAVNDKELVFNVGDGASNPSITIDATNKDFTLNKALKVGNALLQLGTGSPADVEIELDYGLGGAANPKLIYKSADDAWFFRNANGVDKRIGSGGGGGKNVFNQLTNPGFEDGVTSNWTASGLVPTELTNAADVGIGLKSARIDCSGAGQYYEADLETFANVVVDGFSCQADFKYKGGDALWDVKILDGAAAVVASDTLSASTDWRDANSIYFRCDALGSDQAKIRFECTGDAAQLDLDEVYLGNMTGLSEAALPDTFGAALNSSGNVLTESADFIDGSCIHAAAVYTCTFVSGLFTVAPSCVVTANGGGGSSERIATIRILSTTTLEYRTDIASTGVANSNPAQVICQKQGVDAKQTVQIFQNVPKVAENLNQFSMKGSNSGVVSDENADWINGNCTNITPGDFACAFVAGTFDAAPNCQVTARVGIDGYGAHVTSVSNTSIGFTTTVNGTTSSSVAHTLNCERSTDHKTVEVQPIVIRQVETGLKAGLITHECQINGTSGTPLSQTTTLCDYWIDSYTDLGPGNYRANFNANAFKPGGEVNCTCSSLDNESCYLGALPTPSLVELVARDAATTLTDARIFLTCTGER